MPAFLTRKASLWRSAAAHRSAVGTDGVATSNSGCPSGRKIRTWLSWQAITGIQPLLLERSCGGKWEHRRQCFPMNALRGSFARPACMRPRMRPARHTAESTRLNSGYRIGRDVASLFAGLCVMAQHAIRCCPHLCVCNTQCRRQCREGMGEPEELSPLSRETSNLRGRQARRSMRRWPSWLKARGPERHHARPACRPALATAAPCCRPPQRFCLIAFCHGRLRATRSLAGAHAWQGASSGGSGVGVPRPGAAQR